MDFNSEVNRFSLIAKFPKLVDDVNFNITSAQTSIYNCIAWAMNLTDRWVDPDISPGKWWPDGVERSLDYNALIEAFKALGFSLADNSNYEEGYDKVVLYGANGEWKHASKVTPNDTEHSKFGEEWDCEHSHAVLQGLQYGEEYAYMKRPISDRIISEKISTIKGAIKVLKRPIWKNANK